MAEMTPQKALEILEMFLHKQCDLQRTEFAYSDIEVYCAVSMAKNALEKQIPKKPIKYDDCEQFFIECPCCQKKFDSRLGYKGCPYCLQAIRLE